MAGNVLAGHDYTSLAGVGIYCGTDRSSALSAMVAEKIMVGSVGVEGRQDINGINLSLLGKQVKTQVKQSLRYRND